MRSMKIIHLVLAGAFLLAMIGRPLQAADDKIKVIGTVVKIEMASPDAKEATATLKVKGKMIPITIQDGLTLNKFKIKKIQPGDEIRCFYKVIDGKNVSTSFLKTAGC
jgi:hypothetical protein